MPEHNNQVDLHVKKGSDYTVQIFWLDDYDEPVPVVQPARMDIRTADEQRTLICRCEPGTITGDTSRGYLSTSEPAGLVTVYIPQHTTAAMPEGTYVYDLFANYRRYATSGEISGPGTADWGDYHVRMIAAGLCIVHPNVTEYPSRRPDDT